MRYKFARSYVKNKRVLDVACGTRYRSYELSKGACRGIGVDISGEAIKFTQNNYKKSNLSFMVVDARALRFENESFDVVCSFETIEHILNYRKSLEEFLRVLKPNGIFIISTPNKEASIWISFSRERIRHPDHFKEFAQSELLNLLSDYFVGVKLYGHGETRKAPYGRVTYL